MSTVSVAVTTVSDKFQKELTKFFAWAQQCGISIRDANTSMMMKWDMNLLKSFEEPARNKLEIYIRDLLKLYVIMQNGEEVEDYKTLAKEYKNGNKEKKESDKTESSEQDTPKPKKSKAKAPKTSTTNIELDASLDTSETYYIETLDFTTEQIMSKWGRPEMTGTDETKHRYEWKFTANENVYSIYDWVLEDGTYEELDNAEWFLAGITSNKTQTKNVINKLTELFTKEQTEEQITNGEKVTQTKVKKTKEPKAPKEKKPREKKQKKTEKFESDLDSSSDEVEMVTKSMEAMKIPESTPQFSKDEMKEMFGSESEDDESIDINLDDLE
jgi:hypothetical protein